VKGIGVACGSHIAEETARGRYDATPIRHSLGRKVADATILSKCCNPGTSGGRWRRAVTLSRGH
jgi:hypothetical protein